VARLDAAGVLHSRDGPGNHVTEDLFGGHGSGWFCVPGKGLVEEKAWGMYAGTHMSNHSHLLIRTGEEPIRRWLKGY
jgi:hypothetical protein